ncbi:acyl-CoA synthetase [Dietzia alimentaria]|uniref:acyl-CoA synthetase n=1 Tax=Dietzia alimentaria TaxID=665550 RepID=UPI00049555AD|nr:long-chain fatty acid--CoA ligase [Dietzia alimentaria]
MTDSGFGSWATRHALRNGERIAYIDGVGGVTTTYAELEDRTNRLADALTTLGVQRGDRVAMLLLNSPQMMEIYIAVAKLGAISVPVNFRLHPSEVAYVLEDSGSSFLFYSTIFADAVDAATAENTRLRTMVAVPTAQERTAGGGHYEMLLEGASADRVENSISHEDICVLMYTSGTTGRPKGAMLTHGNFFHNAVNSMGLGSGIGRTDVTVSAAPLFHIGALGVHTLPFLFVGATVVITESFSPDLWLDAVEHHRATTAFLVPAMWAAIAQSNSIRDRELSGLRSAISGGAPCPITVIHALREYGMEFTEGFGMTETSPNAACLQPEEVVDHAGSIGRPVLLMDFRIVDEQGYEVPTDEVGELCVRGPNVFVGYWGKPAETDRALRGGWFHTGDLARRDEQGFYTLVDRKKDMVITGGENVYPIEVEQVMYQHPEVREVAVVGIPDDAWGERVMAVVVRTDGSTLQADELRQWTRERIAHFKAPSEVRFAEELPRTATGKLLKRELRKTYTGTGAAVSR